MHLHAFVDDGVDSALNLATRLLSIKAKHGDGNLNDFAASESSR